MATGPGQTPGSANTDRPLAIALRTINNAIGSNSNLMSETPGSANTDRPLAIALRIINNAIGSNSNLMSVTQSGTPTFNYPGGQNQNGSPTILPNPAVPYVNCFAYSNGTGKSRWRRFFPDDWTTICFNNNLTTAESVTLTGPGAPAGRVSETLFPKPANVITDNNEDTFLGAASNAPVVAVSSPSSTSAATYSIPPASFIALTYPPDRMNFAPWVVGLIVATAAYTVLTLRRRVRPAVIRNAAVYTARFILRRWTTSQ